ncbi:hypothetical protein T09_3640, partial [Trichinella sp. T9]
MQHNKIQSTTWKAALNWLRRYIHKASRNWSSVRLPLVYSP